jgi:hypothetical protein
MGGYKLESWLRIGTCEHGNNTRIPQNSRISLTTLPTVSFLIKVVLHGVQYLV